MPGPNCRRTLRALALVVGAAGCNPDLPSHPSALPGADFAAASRQATESAIYSPFCVTFQEYAACMQVEVKATDQPRGGKQVTIQVRNLDGEVLVPGYEQPKTFAIRYLGLEQGGDYGSSLSSLLLLRTKKGAVGVIGTPAARSVVDVEPTLVRLSTTISGCHPVGYDTYITCRSQGYPGLVEASFTTQSSAWSLAQSKLHFFGEMTTYNPDYAGVAFECFDGADDRPRLSCGVVKP